LSDRVDGYAAALLDVTRAEGLVDRVVDELFRFARAFERNDALRSALTDESIPADRRQAIVEEIVGGKASPLTASLVSFVVGTGRAHDLVAIIDRFVERAVAEQQREVAEVRSSIPLDGELKQRLAQALSSALGKQVEVKVIVDPSVMGGLVAKVGDTVIDGSVRHRLDQLRETL
jgi:F-type H+-transporting ATPase subunit delta